MELDPVLPSRVQFAFARAFHNRPRRVPGDDASRAATVWEAASSPSTQGFMLIGVDLSLPLH